MESTKKNSTYKKWNNEQVIEVCRQLLEKLPELLDHFDIEYIEYPNRYAMPCPIHGGDSPEGCTIFTDGNNSKGNWRCWTNSCHEEQGQNILGWLKGVLSQTSGREYYFGSTMAWAVKFLNCDIEDIQEREPDPLEEANKLIAAFEKKPNRDNVSKITKEQIRETLSYPCEYYMGRGYSEETLNHFDVGLCTASGKPMSGRVVVPIYDEEHRYVGCVGRSLDPNRKPKWLHSKGFRKASYLYGMQSAKEHILSSGTIVLVEGQGDVWRLYEAGIKNTVGIFGANLSDEQMILLEQSGALNVVVLTDTDEAGEKAAKQIKEKCGRRFNYYRPEISQKDVGEMSIEMIQLEVIEPLKGIL